MTPKLFLSVALALAPVTARADALSLTIYNDDLSLVQDVRRLDIAAGRSRQEFIGVSAMIRPETVTLRGDGLAVVEQNFDFDLLSPDKLMEKAVGRQVTIVRTNPATGAELREVATVLAANGGIVLQIGNRIEVLRDDGLPVRVIFDRVPDNLRARPTLSVTVEAARGGARDVSLSYLTPGLGWKADYVALFDEGKSQLDLQGWVTLTNTSGTSYATADVLLVAGTPNDGDQQPRYRRSSAAGRMDVAGTESGSRDRLGDYYLYPLGERTTVAHNQTKQVSFLDVKAVPARKGYEYRVPWLFTTDQPVSARSVLKFSNSAKGGLGDQLPAGTMRFYIKDAKGQPQYIGETSLGHTPMGSELSMATGDAFDVKVKTTNEKRERLTSRRWMTSMSYLVSNARPEAVTVDLVQDGLWGDARVAAESLKSRRLNANALVWSVPVPANGRVTVTATFDTRY
jgi:hypothetical protein